MTGSSGGGGPADKEVLINFAVFSLRQGAESKDQ